jgi:hypothetical protein
MKGQSVMLLFTLYEKRVEDHEQDEPSVTRKVFTSVK